MIYDYETFDSRNDVTKFLQELEEDGIDPKKNVISISSESGLTGTQRFTVWYKKKDSKKKDSKKKNL